MKPFAIATLALLPLVSTPATAIAPPNALPATPGAELDESDRARITAEVTDFLAHYLTVLEAGDSEAIRELYVADERFAWYTDGEKRYATVDELLASLAGMEGMTFSTESSEVEVLPLTPELSHASSAFQTKITQGERVVFEYGGVITWLLERSGGDRWRVLRGHTSTPGAR